MSRRVDVAAVTQLSLDTVYLYSIFAVGLKAQINGHELQEHQHAGRIADQTSGQSHAVGEGASHHRGAAA
ncbi:hypothetical protein PSEUDO8Z_60477 [Pseudomonas sp. 8Z]|nr:hypothetical protein PSEUDO8Z_60477 [Pseudomonas sp. 8Z]